jgi:hypothetical protein
MGTAKKSPSGKLIFKMGERVVERGAGKGGGEIKWGRARSDDFDEVSRNVYNRSRSAVDKESMNFHRVGKEWTAGGSAGCWMSQLALTGM